MLIKKSIVRGIIPLVIMTILSIIMHVQGIEEQQVRSTFIVGIIVTSVAAASVIYDNKQWSLTKQSAIHFIIMLLTVFPCLLLSEWFQLNNIIDYLTVFGLFVLIRIVLWSISYFVFGKLLSK